ncbi:MAG TPA: DUF4397 domain-containing protein [Candidatus Dormibacteraeota bacterium]|nr:DUF4397 domain-containing protein [Candidatus Dormibacteraeota bacterium]
MRVRTTAVMAVAMGVTVWAAAGAWPARAAVQASIRVAYLSPDASNADIYVDGVATLSNIGYKTVSTYLPVGQGTHTLSVRQAGAAASSTPLTEVSQNFSDAAFYTVAIGGRFGHLQSTVFADRFATPAAGQVLARFVHMAPDVPGVDVAVKGGPVIFTNISFLQASQYTALPSGTYSLELRATGTSNVLFTANGVAAKGGTVDSFAGVGGVNQPVELLPILDASAAAVVPTGGAKTGGGGTAEPTTSIPGATSLWLLPVLLTALTWLVIDVRRRRDCHS